MLSLFTITHAAPYRYFDWFSACGVVHKAVVALNAKVKAFFDLVFFAVQAHNSQFVHSASGICGIPECDSIQRAAFKIFACDGDKHVPTTCTLPMRPAFSTAAAAPGAS